MDLFELLSAEHEVLAALLGRIAELLDRSLHAEVADHFSVFSTSFELHSQAEGEAVYPVLGEGPPALEALVRDAEHHHALAETHIDRLSRMDVSLPQWRTHFEALVDLIQDHIALEEGAIRDVASAELTSDFSAELAHDYLECKRRLARPVDGGLFAGPFQVTPEV